MRAPLRVAVDARMLVTHPFGTARYARELLRWLAAAPDFEPLAIVDRDPGPLAAELGGVEMRVVPHLRPGFLWEQVRVPLALRGGGIELYHAPFNIGLSAIAPFPGLLTVHDLLPLQSQWRLGSPRARLYYRASLGISLRCARAIIAVSQATREEILRRTDVPAARVRVVHEAPAEVFRPRQPGDAELLREIPGLALEPSGYFLCVAYPRPHKNLPRLVAAHAALAADLRARLPLVLVGCPAAHLRETLGAATPPDVVAPGFVAEEHLAVLYANALALVFPSLYEGFGLPVLEAMASATPVICSSRGALGEVAVDAALLVDPEDVAAISAAMRRVAADEPLRADLAARSAERARQFPAERCREETLEIYREVARGG